jgi:hypothetical protein
MTAVLREAGEIGPFFVVASAADGAVGDGWRPLADLVSDRAVVRERVESARAVLAARTGLAPDAVEIRATASIVFLGLAARLVSPPLASGVLAGAVPRWTVADLSWQPVPGGPWPLAARPAAAGGSLSGTILDGVVGPVLEAFQREFALSPKVLWGNVASGLAGAAGMLAGARPDRAEAAAALVAEALAVPPLRGTGAWIRPDPAYARRFFVRRSCCLFYRVPGAGLCGDCVLTPDDVRREQWKSALSR